MASREQIWLSPNLEKRRWAAKLRSTYGARRRAPELRAPDLTLLKNKTSKSERHVVWIADVQRDDLEKLRRRRCKLPQVKLIGVIGKGAPPKTMTEDHDEDAMAAFARNRMVCVAAAR